jgi:CRP-like cAMP-binding protein
MMVTTFGYALPAMLAPNTSLLEILGHEERKRFVAQSRKLQFRPGEVVESSGLGEEIFLVETGAFIERLYCGARAVPIVRIAGSGDLLYADRLFAPVGFMRVELRAVHIESNSLYAWSATEFLELLRNSPEGMLRLCRWFGYQAHAGRLNLYEAVAHSAYYRLVNLLVALSNQFGYLNANGSTVLLPLKLTIKDLSECINVSRETGSNLFNKLRRKGVIGPGKFIKVELSKLSEYAATLE